MTSKTKLSPLYVDRIRETGQEVHSWTIGVPYDGEIRAFPKNANQEALVFASRRDVELAIAGLEKNGLVDLESLYAAKFSDIRRIIAESLLW